MCGGVPNTQFKTYSFVYFFPLRTEKQGKKTTDASSSKATFLSTVFRGDFLHTNDSVFFANK